MMEEGTEGKWALGQEQPLPASQGSKVLQWSPLSLVAREVALPA